MNLLFFRKFELSNSKENNPIPELDPWWKEDDDFIWDNRNESTEVLIKKFPQRTRGAILTRKSLVRKRYAKKLGYKTIRVRVNKNEYIP
jgi:hypothetical protein